MAGKGIFLKGLAILVGVPALAIALFYLWASSTTTDPQTYADVIDDDAQLQPSAKDSYTLVTYNIGYLSGLANSTTTKPDQSFFEANQQQAIAALSAINPDFIALQEVDFGAERSYGVNQAKVLAQTFNNMAYAVAINWDKTYLPFPFWPPSAHFGKILSGQALLSRYPITENTRTVLQKVAANNFIYNTFYLDRLLQVSKVNIDGKTLVVMSTHLEAFDEETRVAQTQFVKNAAEDYAKTYPVLLVGDFNSALNRDTFIAITGEDKGEKQFSIKELIAAESFEPATPQSAWPTAASADNATFPSNAPEYKLDYIFYTPSTIEITEARVLSAAGEASDHLPIMARFRLK